MNRSALTSDDPQRIGKYMLASRLGVGGQGVVYEAYGPDGGRVALKVLHRAAAAVPGSRGRLAKEVAAARRVASFCTARVLAADPRAEQPYIVSEFIPGVDLATAVRASGVIGGDALQRLATGVATALVAIHRAGVVHRDLKPGNVLLGPDGPRVIDFGIAHAPDMTLTDGIRGTFGYLAPEVLCGGRPDAAADVFAWGATLLFAATGREPFRGENFAESVVRTTEHEPELDDVYPDLRPLLHEALAKHPEDRPDAEGLLTRLLGGGRVDPRAALAAGAKTSATIRILAVGAAVVPTAGELAAGAYQVLRPAAQEAARELWLRLVVPGEAPDGSSDGVRAATEDELLSGRSDVERTAVREAVDAFVVAGLLVRESAWVRPISAAPLRAWTRLREWVDEDRDGLTALRRIGDAARRWDHDGRRREDLEHGTVLRRALDWAATAPGRLRPNALERAFLDASRTADARGRRLRRTLLSVTAVLVVLLVVAGSLAWQRGRAEERQHLLAESQRISSLADGMRATDPLTSMRLAVAAWRLGDTLETRSELLGAMTRRESDIFTVPSDEDGPLPRLVDDGRILVTYHDHQVVRWDVPHHRSTGSVAVPADDPGSSVAADGQTVMLPAEQDGGLVTQVWDLARQQRIGRPVPGGWHYSLGFSPDGRLLMLATPVSHVFQLWDVRQHRTVFESQQLMNDSGATAALSPDDRFLAVNSNGGPLELRDLARRTWLRIEWIPASGPSPDGDDLPKQMVFSPDSRTIALLAADGIRRWNVSSGAELPAIHNPGVKEAAFSDDGKFLVTEDGSKVLLWSLSSTDQPVFQYRLDAMPCVQIALDAAAHAIRCLSQSRQGTSVLTLDLGYALDPGWHTAAAKAAAFGAEARFLAVFRDEPHTTRLELRNGNGDRVLGRPLDLRRSGPPDQVGQKWPEDFVPLLSFSRDGGLLAYGLVRELGNGPPIATGVTVWDSRRRRTVATIAQPRHATYPEGVALSPDGTQLATTRLGRPLKLQQVHSTGMARTLAGDGARSGGYVLALAFRPDGRLLVDAGTVVALPTGRKVGPGPGDWTSALVFSANGKYFAAGDRGGGVTLWNGDGRRRLDAPPVVVVGGTEGQGRVTALAFSPDGRTLAAGDAEGNVRTWDVPSMRPLGGLLQTAGDKVLALSFGADGKTLHVAGAHALDQSYALAPDQVARSLCKRARLGLTRAEWRVYLPQVPYRPTC